MTVETSIRRSPLADWAAAFDQLLAGIQILEMPFLTQLSLRLDPGGPAAASVQKAIGVALPTAPCTFVGTDEVEALWLGPDEWLLVAPPGTQTRLQDALRAAIGDDVGTVTDVSAQRTTLCVSGSLTREVLARGCAIDLHPRVSPVGTCVQTRLAQAGVILLVRDDTATCVRLLVRSSFAAYAASWLVDACTEYREEAL
ncbi:sarcosine oxidase subunit gamma family protein [Streptomyces sp. NPDC048415]|uniref:sarcosine oxidase subunit gamma n=1 Tax=Streptomyces sp. NPDC048415 TaxID=3154822 RepID=UPI0034305D12